jgi:hypothetical protein
VDVETEDGVMGLQVHGCIDLEVDGDIDDDEDEVISRSSDLYSCSSRSWNRGTLITTPATNHGPKRNYKALN